LDVAQRYAGVEGGSNESVSQRVGADRLDDPGSSSNVPHDASCAVPVETPAVAGGKDRPCGSFADGQVDGASGARRKRDGDGLAALAEDGEGPMAALDADGLDVGADRFGYRNPLSASSEIKACSVAGPSPAATRSAPTSLRSRPMAWDS
jgi:hypothetical protein